MTHLSTELRDNTLHVAGEIDMSNSAALQHAIRAAFDTGTRARLDLSAVTFIDSHALRTLLRATQDHTVELTATSANVARLLELTGTTSQFAPAT